MINTILLCAAPFQISGLVDQLPNDSLREDACHALCSLSAEEVVPELFESLMSDEHFASGTNARQSAYRILVRIRSSTDSENEDHDRISNSVQLALLRSGLSDPDYGIREISVSSLSSWLEIHSPEAVEHCVGALGDNSPIVKIAACEALARIGQNGVRAQDALQALLLSSESLGWKQVTLPSGFVMDFSLRGRAAVAYARSRVLGFTVDRNQFGGIDNVGKKALSLGWARFISTSFALEMASLQLPIEHEGDLGFEEVIRGEDTFLLLAQFIMDHGHDDEASSAKILNALSVAFQGEYFSRDLKAELLAKLELISATEELQPSIRNLSLKIIEFGTETN